MAQPKKKVSKSKRDMRRANWLRIDPPALVECNHCRQPHIPHHACPHCGYYDRRPVVAVGEEPKKRK